MSAIEINDFPVMCNRIVILEGISIVPNVQARINVGLYNGGIHLTTEEIVMEGEDYANWGEDDVYLEEFVLRYYGMTRRINGN
jgi:hypothetical protein